MVTELIKESPAASCGLKVGDVILGIADEAGNRWDGFLQTYLTWIQSNPPGTRIVITVLRDEKTVRIQAVLGELKE